MATAHHPSLSYRGKVLLLWQAICAQTITNAAQIFTFYSFLFFLKGDAIVEGLRAIVAFREEVDADGADVHLGAKILIL